MLINTSYKDQQQKLFRTDTLDRHPKVRQDKSLTWLVSANKLNLSKNSIIANAGFGNSYFNLVGNESF